MDTDSVRTIRVGGFFSGIGSHHSAVDRLDIPGVEFVVRWQCDFDERKVRAYDLMHGPTPNLGDITKVTDLDGERETDLVVWSPPCQSISISRHGCGEGNAKGSGTRSALAFEVPRILRNTVHRPEYLIMEEVPMMVSEKYRSNFDELLSELSDLGYRHKWKVVNATEFGVGQSRRRCICVSRLNAEPPDFPTPSDGFRPLRDYLEDDETVPESYFLNRSRLEGMVRSTEKERERGNGFRFRPYLPPYEGASHAIVVNQGRKYCTYIISGRRTENIQFGLSEQGLFDRLGIPYDNHFPRRGETGENHD